MTLRIYLAAGISLALLHSSSAVAGQSNARTHSIHSRSIRDIAVRDRLVGDHSQQHQAQWHRARQTTGKVEDPNKETAALKDRVANAAVVTLSSVRKLESTAFVEPKGATLKVPEANELGADHPQYPVDPVTAAKPEIADDQSDETSQSQSALDGARAYLIRTASPGYTMTVLGVSTAIGALHPALIVKLAEAVKLAREAGMPNAGVMSGYRPPGLGVGGFSNKFMSMHSYGLAVDMTGIGGPGSKTAHQWQTIVEAVGLYLPYGPDNRAEFNHTQLLPEKVAPSNLPATITADGPKDLRQMWLASSIDPNLIDATSDQAVRLAASEPDEERIIRQAQAAAELVGAPGQAHVQALHRSELHAATRVSKSRGIHKQLSDASRHLLSQGRRHVS
jgi:hypothetical protein